MNPIEIIKWAREQEAKFARMAEAAEALIESEGKAMLVAVPEEDTPNRVVSRPPRSNEFMDVEITPESLNNFLRQKGSARPADIALAFNLPKPEVLAFLNRHSDLFPILNRGWVKPIGTE